jgi:transposase
MEQIHDRVAGLDVHRDQVAACVRTPGPRGGVHMEKARFTATTGGLEVLAGWLAEREVALVAMEATGVYWKPVYYALEDRFALWLCNAQHVKNVPGRKTDMSDAEWLADVAAHGMVRSSFVPPPAIRELRELTRYRRTQTDVRASEIARLEKVLQDAGIKLTSVASKVLTQSGRAMVEALIAGQRDPVALAGLAKGQTAAEDPGADRSSARPLRRPSRRRRGSHPGPPGLPRRDGRVAGRPDCRPGGRRLPASCPAAVRGARD